MKTIEKAIPTLKKIPLLMGTYSLYRFIKNIKRRALWNIRAYTMGSEVGVLRKEVREEARKRYALDLNIKNPRKWFSGKNVLGYPTLTHATLDGKQIGWMDRTISKNNLQLPIIQVDTDVQKNIPLLIETYKPSILADFGTALGGTAVMFFDLMSSYCNPKVLSVDISDESIMRHKTFHDANGTFKKVSFLFKDSLTCAQELKDFLARRNENDRFMISFDDDHSYTHTYKELCLYVPLLKKGDIVVMQDTWDQDLYGHEESPMLAVHKYLKTHSDLVLDEEFSKRLTLPSNFIYGVLIKQ